jgi:tryptophanyl-tRNA synthetase
MWLQDSTTKWEKLLSFLRLIQEDSMLIPGTNGGKMSKSANNIINIFLDDKALKSKSWALKPTARHSKNQNPDTCNAFAIYSLLANAEQLAEQIT